MPPPNLSIFSCRQSVTHCHFRNWTQRVTLVTWDPSDIWSEWRLNKNTKTKRPKREFHIVLSCNVFQLVAKCPNIGAANVPQKRAADWSGSPTPTLTRSSGWGLGTWLALQPYSPFWAIINILKCWCNFKTVFLYFLLH